MSTKAMAMLEMIFALIVLMAVISVGAVIFFQVIASQRGETVKKDLDYKVIEASEFLLQSSKLNCQSCGGSSHERCFDRAKLETYEAGSEIGRARVSITQVYPLGKTWQIYSFGNSQAGVASYLPVLICDPIEKTFSYGELKIEIVP